MANIEDYVKWRGDLRFAQDSFNEIDSLILTQLSYLDFEGIIPSFTENKSISMPKLIEKYWLKYSPADIEKCSMLIRQPSALLEILKQSRRFSELQFANYVNRVDKKKQKQFSAMTVWIPDGTIYISYRGTDTTMIGWRENLNMSFMDQVPSQLDAVNYLRQVYDWSNFKIRMGGHSKGGNLAVYAGMNIREEIADKIISIENFDGPGFREKVINQPQYVKILSKVKTYVPETSIVGRLLEHSEMYSVVKSCGTGAWQHDAFTWQLEANQFIYSSQFDTESDIVESTVKRWLDMMSTEEREKFVDTFFVVLEKAEINSVTDFTEINWKKTVELIKAMNDLSNERKKQVNRVLRLLWKQAKTVIGEEIGFSEKKNITKKIKNKID